MKTISGFILLGSVFCMVGCVQQCNPTYLSDSSAFEKIERVKGLPIKINAEDNRTSDKKFFMKLSLMNYYEKGGKHFNEHQLLQLGKPSKEIIQTAFGEGFNLPKKYQCRITSHRSSMFPKWYYRLWCIQQNY